MKSGSNLEKVLTAGHFAFTGEVGPPRGANPESIRTKAAFLKGNVDMANMTDNQTAMVRMSSMAGSMILLEEGVEPNLEYENKKQTDQQAIIRAFTPREFDIFLLLSKP